MYLVSFLLTESVPIKKPAKRKPTTIRKTSRFSSLAKWGLPTVTLLLGLILGSCSEKATNTAQELSKLTHDVSLKDKPGQVLNTTAPGSSVGQDVVAPPEKRTGAEPFGQCPQFFAGGQSPLLAEKPLQRPLCYEAFAILYNGKTKTPVFVAERLNKRSVADADEKRTDKYFADARLRSSERAELSDYKGSGYSKGHMAPAGNMPTPAAMAQSFSLANMVPQIQKHNGGVWSKIEHDTRKYAERATGNVYVITGPFYTPGNTKFIGAGKVAVPDYIFKLVYDEAGNRAWAHWHRNSGDERGGPPISYKELVKRTGIEFLPGAGL